MSKKKVVRTPAPAVPQQAVVMVGKVPSQAVSELCKLTARIETINGESTGFIKGSWMDVQAILESVATYSESTGIKVMHEVFPLAKTDGHTHGLHLRVHRRTRDSEKSFSAGHEALHAFLTDSRPGFPGSLVTLQ